MLRSKQEPFKLKLEVIWQFSVRMYRVKKDYQLRFQFILTKFKEQAELSLYFLYGERETGWQISAELCNSLRQLQLDNH